MLYGGDGGHTGGIQQGEHQEDRRGEGAEQGGDPGRISAQKQGQGRHHAFLGGKAGDEGSGSPPVTEAQGLEDGGYQAAQQSQQTDLRGGGYVQADVEGLQHPDDDGGGKDNGEGLLHKALGFFPDQLAHALGAGQPIVGQLHHEGHRLPGEGGVLQDQGIQDPAEDAKQVQADHSQRL